jgi:hypothetical protein
MTQNMFGFLMIGFGLGLFVSGLPNLMRVGLLHGGKPIPRHWGELRRYEIWQVEVRRGNN